MRCDKCGVKIMMHDENWQRFEIMEDEYTLCQPCVNLLFDFLKGDMGE